MTPRGDRNQLRSRQLGISQRKNWRASGATTRTSQTNRPQPICASTYWPEANLSNRNEAYRDLANRQRDANRELTDGDRPSAGLPQGYEITQGCLCHGYDAIDAWPIASTPTANRPTATIPLATTRRPVFGDRP